MLCNNTIRILKMPVAVTSYSQASKKIISASLQKKGRYVCVANVHMCMETFDDPQFSRVLYNADLVVPDSKPLVWSQFLLGKKKAAQVRGSDLLLNLCEKALKEGIPIGLYGGTPKSLNDFITFLKSKYPDLKIPFALSPPFRELTIKEDENHVELINASNVRILFIGIGCPKQEKWMAFHKDRVNCIMIGVGAAFDFFSGQKKQAPRWMQHAGVEWVFRLFSDPKRLWKRYLKHNPRFVYYFLKQLLGKTY